MNLKKAFNVPVLLVLACGFALAQTPATPPAPPAPPAPGEPATAFSMFFNQGGFLGVHTEDITKENLARYNMREVRGVGITEIVKDSPAEKAGLRKDDVIVRFEGDNITSTRKLSRLVSEVAPDHTVRLTISRGGSEQEVNVTLGKRAGYTNTFRALEGMKGFEGLKDLKEFEKFKDFKSLPPGAHVWKWEGKPGDPESFVFSFGGGRRIGVSTMPLTKQLGDYFGIADGKGVLVTGVTDDSPAARAGIRAGDVIISVDGEKVDGSGDVSRAINKKKEGDVTLTVVRDKNQRSFTVTPKAAEPMTPGAAPRVGRVIMPRVQVGAIPAINIVTPRIELPIIPEIRIEVGDEDGNPRVIRRRAGQPI